MVKAIHNCKNKHQKIQSYLSWIKIFKNRILHRKKQFNTVDFQKIVIQERLTIT